MPYRSRLGWILLDTDRTDGGISPRRLIVTTVDEDTRKSGQSRPPNNPTDIASGLLGHRFGLHRLPISWERKGRPYPATPPSNGHREPKQQVPSGSPCHTNTSNPSILDVRSQLTRSTFPLSTITFDLLPPANGRNCTQYLRASAAAASCCFL